MKFSILVFFAFTLAGCAASMSTYEPPIVDMRGVDQQKYAQDLHECTEEKKEAGFITLGGMISRCLTQHGYNVTIPKT